MKNVFTLLLVIAVTNACATMTGAKAPQESRSIEKIIEIANVSKSDLFVRVNSWFVDAFTSAESVIEYQDKEAGRVMGKYSFSYYEGLYAYRIKSTITVDVKDGRCRISINDPMYAVKAVSTTYSTYSGYRPLETQVGIDKAKAEWEKLIASLKVSILKKTEW